MNISHVDQCFFFFLFLSPHQDFYEIGRQLGRGTFGEVYETTQIKTQSKWAIKMVRRPPVSTFLIPLGGLYVCVMKRRVKKMKELKKNCCFI